MAFGAPVSPGGHATYKAAVNRWALNVTALASPSVPLMKASIKHLVEHYFRTPAVIPLDIHVSVKSPEDAESAIANRTLQVVSAPEILFAFIQAVHADLNRATDETGRWSVPAPPPRGTSFPRRTTMIHKLLGSPAGLHPQPKQMPYSVELLLRRLKKEEENT